MKENKNNGRIRYWTFEKCEEESRKYINRTQFYKGNQSAYRAAWMNGWLQTFFTKSKHFRHERGYWTYERCRELCNACIDKAEINRKHPGAYAKVYEKGWIELFPVVIPNSPSKELSKYRDLSELYKTNSTLYRYMLKFEWQKLKDAFPNQVRSKRRKVVEKVV